MLSDLKARLKGQHLTDPDYAFLLSDEPADEAVVLQCDATSFDAAKADLRTVAAVRVRGNRILTSQHIQESFWPTEPAEPALGRVLHFIGNRPLVGFVVDFSGGLLDRYVQPMIGIPLPNRRIDVSELYYSSRTKVPGKNAVDLRLDSILGALGLPERTSDGAYGTAVAVAMAYVRLRALNGG